MAAGSRVRRAFLHRWPYGNLARMPRWALLFLGAVIAALLAIYLSPVFPPPLSMILYWVFWVLAAIAVIMGVLDLLGMARGRGSRSRI